jgi:hypothetical protein
MMYRCEICFEPGHVLGELGIFCHKHGPPLPLPTPEELKQPPRKRAPRKPRGDQ